MTNAENAEAGAPEWDARKLGHDEEFVKRAPKSHEDALDNALGLQMISVRLQKQLISDLKFIATAHGIGYQPLIRDILSRFVTHEKKQIIREAVERRALELKQKEQEAQAKEEAARNKRKVA
jgi:hypothetical protein